MLLVIDMQEQFRASTLVLDEVLKQVEAAVKKREWIFFLEYADYGRTFWKLRKVVKGYKRVAFVTKRDDDGRYWFSKRYNRLGLRARKLYVCGVNTNACVKRTVFGLASEYNFDIIVLKDACANSRKRWHNLGLSFMTKIKGIKFQ